MKIGNFIIILLFLMAITPLSAKSENAKKIALVLGSGGSKGIAHVGVIEELGNLGIIPDLIIGCSSGAIVGSLYAQHRNIEEVKEVLIHLKYKDLVDLNVFQKRGISTRKKMRKFLKHHLIIKDFDALVMPFIAVAADLKTGEPVYFREGKLTDAILASTAVPGLFAPYKIGNNVYIDGGVCDPLPVRYTKSLGEYIVIASDVSSSLEELNPRDLFQVICKSFEIVCQRLAYFERKDADILLEMNFSPSLDSPTHHTSNQQIYERGKEIVRNQSQQIVQLISSGQAD